MSAALPSLEEVRRAANRIAPLVERTPVVPSPALSLLLGSELALKLECGQRTGSFKIRGAANAVAAAIERGGEPDAVVTASAGNHGAGVALAAHARGLAAHVFVPDDAPEIKTRSIVVEGAILHLVADGYDAAERAALDFADAEGGLFVHAFDDPDVVAGQGTLGLEILEERPDVRSIVVPVGGGGLLAGVGAATREGEHRPSVHGAQSERTRAMHDAFVAGEVVATDVVPTLADGLAGAVSRASFERARQVTERIELVSEEDIREAIRLLFHHHGVVAEGAGAVPLAALLAGARVSEPAILVITGGNIDREKLAGILGGESG